MPVLDEFLVAMIDQNLMMVDTVRPKLSVKIFTDTSPP